MGEAPKPSAEPKKQRDFIAEGSGDVQKRIRERMEERGQKPSDALKTEGELHAEKTSKDAQKFIDSVVAAVDAARPDPMPEIDAALAKLPDAKLRELAAKAKKDPKNPLFARAKEIVDSMNS